MHDFIHRMVLRNSTNAAIQRANVYSSTTSQIGKNAFREDLKRWLTQLGLRYFAWEYNGKKYCDEITSLKTHLNTRHSFLLNGGNVKIGVCQKAITLYLKYLWLLGDNSKKPIYATLDRGIMNLAGVTNPPNWTELDDIQEYERVVREIDNFAQNQGWESGSVWEAETWTDEEDAQQGNPADRL